MQTREATATTHTLLEAQDIHATANFRGAPINTLRPPPPARAAPHDFLVLNQRPDLTPAFSPTRPTNGVRLA